jgi:hypothetical protein
LFEALDPGAFGEFPRRFKNSFLDQVRLDVVRHGKGEASDLVASLNAKAAVAASVATSLCEALG